ncbi:MULTISPECIES: hypothetical protein [Methanobacterium]|jgi:hypothetical protein|uniref:Uncharacterized protein n=1 Tax=Methanobacterium formicicum TaxID=2162 RepID=A0A090I588_METFO|nr:MULTISPECIES: hypothetical protein [Methanobacterium]AIS31598.1 hypothetical protein BRM9_0778 [Methanobacterium formicicum]KUK75548.1 MAG: Uncharacterized protein XD90_0188 [Methanobacterium sp. 42_16]MBF4475816.1 hypothetical protein [Methanobacterium formicicum]MDD4810023.1 hypothetical protein [Methanobacterium formicicum]MDG3548018.1 hypothetical protein [Methanobacterium formicicum]
MWLPSEDPQHTVRGNLKKSQIPEVGYVKILDGGNESLLLVKNEKIIAAWNLNVKSLEETYESKAMNRIKVSSESRIEVYKLDDNMFSTIVDLNEECKLPLPSEIDFLIEKADTDRQDVLSKYRIRDPSVDDIDNLLNDYKSKIGGR